MSAPATVSGWYARCIAYLASPPEIRREVSPQTFATYRRIRRLPRVLGEALDRRGAPLFVMRWIAWAVDPSERERRYAAALASWEQDGRWPRWDRLTCRDDENGRLSTPPREETEAQPTTAGEASDLRHEHSAPGEQGAMADDAPSSRRVGAADHEKSCAGENRRRVRIARHGT